MIWPQLIKPIKCLLDWINELAPVCPISQLGENKLKLSQIYGFHWKWWDMNCHGVCYLWGFSGWRNKQRSELFDEMSN